MATTVFKNSVLKALDAQTIERLTLRKVNLELNHEIEFPGEPIEHLFFVEEGMASMTTTFKDGSQVEVGMFGYESVIGVSALMGTKRSLNRIYTQIAGRGTHAGLTLLAENSPKAASFKSSPSPTSKPNSCKLLSLPAATLSMK